LSDRDEPHINADPIEHLVLFLVWNVNGGEKEPFLFPVNQIGFATLESQQFPVMVSAHERNLLATLECPDTGKALVHIPRQDAQIVRNRAVFSEFTLNSLVNFVCIGNLSIQPHNDLSRQRELTADRSIEGLMQRVLSKLFGFPSQFTQAITGCIRRFDRTQQGVRLLERRLKFYLSRKLDARLILPFLKVCNYENLGIPPTANLKQWVSCLISYDGYLKLWQLECLRSGKVPRVFYQYDVVLLDESQDTNPAMESILNKIIQERSHAVVLVGDERQSIYQWRGAVNMMSRIAEQIEDGQINGVRKSLTESFRYGPRAADVASKILSLGCEEKIKIVGRGKDEQNANHGSRCYLSRTNAALMDVALSTLASNPHSVIHFAGTNPINRYDPTVPYKLNLIRSLYHYFANQKHLATDPTIKRFEDWTDILRHAKGGDQDAEAADKELGCAVKFVEKHRYDTPAVLDLIISRSSAPDRAIASFSTAHRAKGLEWDTVKILDDFPKVGSEIDRNEDGEVQLPDEQELNLLYVATTRGRQWVELNNDLLEFVELEFPRHFEELRPSNRNEGCISEEGVTASI
jgi:uncharacterized protein involved in tolerance to divalent cations